MQGMWLSVTVSIELSSSITGTLLSLISHFLSEWSHFSSPPFLYYIYLSFFSSQCGGPGCRGLLASRYIFVLERIVILKTQFFLLMLKTKTIVSPRPPSYASTFSLQYSCVYSLSSPSYFFFNHQLSICDLHILVQSFVFLFSKNLFMFPEIILQFFFTFF